MRRRGGCFNIRSFKRSQWSVSCKRNRTMPDRDRTISNKPQLKPRRKELKNHGTAAEAVLWTYLQRRQILGKKFRRQFSIGCHIVDFFCAECDIAVELDGSPHFSLLGQEYQSARTQFLLDQGIEILRFENKIVYFNIEGVLETIRDAIRRREAGSTQAIVGC